MIIQVRLKELQEWALTGLRLIKLPTVEEFGSEESELALLRYCYYRLIYHVAGKIIEKPNYDIHELVDTLLLSPMGGCVTKECIVAVCLFLRDSKLRKYCFSSLFEYYYAIDVVGVICSETGVTEDLLKAAIKDYNGNTSKDNSSKTKRIIDVFSENTLVCLEGIAGNKYYVYRLVDPRTLHTFYIGKGCGNRVFVHAKNVRSLISSNEDADSLKANVIQEIITAGKEVICIIHRWGMTENEAFEVEAALIDAYPRLTNIQRGHHDERGLITVEDLEALCNMTIYTEPENDYIIIKTSQDAINSQGSLYEATRKSWKANLDRAKKYIYVLATINGVVKEVYVVDKWYKDGDRIAFDGHPATDDMASLKGHIIPDYYRKRGMACPFIYKLNNSD